MSYARDGNEMGLSLLMNLVSQAEKEGVTLASVIARTMSEEDMARAQSEIAMEMGNSSSSIAHFMSGIDIPSLEEIMADDDLQTDDLEEEASDEVLTEPLLF